MRNKKKVLPTYQGVEGDCQKKETALELTSLRNFASSILGQQSAAESLPWWTRCEKACWDPADPDHGRVSAYVGGTQNLKDRNEPHSGLRRYFLAEFKQPTLSVGTTLCPYGISYHRVYTLSNSGLFEKSLSDSAVVNLGDVAVIAIGMKLIGLGS